MRNQIEVTNIDAIRIVMGGKVISRPDYKSPARKRLQSSIVKRVCEGFGGLR